MRHRKKGTKLSRSSTQKKALTKSLLQALITSHRIKTTASKAKDIRSSIDKMITWAKRGDIHAKRLAYRMIGSHTLVKKLFSEIAPKFKEVNGGYTRIINVGYRKGDGALLSIIELTKLEQKKKTKAKKKKQHLKKSEKTPESPKENESTKGFISGVKNIFKK